MTSHKDLYIEQEVKLIRDQERRSSYRELKGKLQVSLDAISSIPKRKREYLGNYERNQNKKFKRNLKDELGQTINNAVYESFVAQRSKRIPVLGLILQEYAKNVAVEMDDSSVFKASNEWLERFWARHNIQFTVIADKETAVMPKRLKIGRHDWERFSEIITHRTSTTVMKPVYFLN